MDEGLLNDLLECSVCLERLDTSSRVLPCQHTFCLKCLKVIVESRKELRCPECRVLVEARIEELPPNVLLMRILEGMKNPKTGGSQRAVWTNANPQMPSQFQQGRDVKNLPPHARAIYDFISIEPSDLSFKKGEKIILQKKLDVFWYQGECNGRTGMFPATYVQVLVPLPTAAALCKALYDFRMTAPDEEGCLAFDKGAIITVDRRVDANWAEGRLDQRVGIFPIAFVELNATARHLLNSAPLNRPVPPTPELARASHCDLARHHAQLAHRYQQMSMSTPATQANYQNVAAMSQSHPNYHKQTPMALPQNVGDPRNINSIIDPQKHSLDLIHYNVQSKSGTMLQSVSRNLENTVKVRKKVESNSQPQQKVETTYQNVRSFPASVASFNTLISSDSSSNTAGVSLTSTPNSSDASTSESVGINTPSSPDAKQRNNTVIDKNIQQEPTIDNEGSRNCEASPNTYEASTRNCGPSLNTNEVSTKNCGPPTNTYDTSTRNCELSPNTYEASTRNCGPSPNTYDASTRNCEASTNTYEASTRNCEPSPNTYEASTRNCEASPNISIGVLSLKESSTATNTSLNVSLPCESESNNLNSCVNTYKSEEPSSSKQSSSGPDSSIQSSTGLNFGLELQAALSPGHKDAYVRHKVHQKEKRHSLTPSTHLQGTHTPNRHSAEILATSLLDHAPERDNHPERERDRRRRRSRSNERPLPATYVALYPYKPQKGDELELRKGDVYTVTERCRDGWFKGFSSERSQRGGAGVFPGNYVAPVSGARPRVDKSTPAASPMPSAVVTKPSGQGPQDAPRAPPRHSALPGQPMSIPWCSSPAQPQPAALKADKCKQPVSLMQRLTSMKKCKSPPPPYCMDNPVFEHSTITTTTTSQTQHVRSGSCPSQLLQALSTAERRRVLAPAHRHNRTTPESPWQSQHRKSQSLDVTSPRKEKHTPVKERFRCIAPYPPHSEHELELRVDDVVLVSKKRADGWYKGTLQRTGRTGLFPASFVQSCPE